MQPRTSGAPTEPVRVRAGCPSGRSAPPGPGEDLVGNAGDGPVAVVDDKVVDPGCLHRHREVRGGPQVPVNAGMPAQRACNRDRSTSAEARSATTMIVAPALRPRRGAGGSGPRPRGPAPAAPPRRPEGFAQPAARFLWTRTSFQGSSGWRRPALRQGGQVDKPSLLRPLGNDAGTSDATVWLRDRRTRRSYSVVELEDIAVFDGVVPADLASFDPVTPQAGVAKPFG
jgi:hypothetical protein